MGPQFLGLLGLARRARSSRAAGGLTLGLSRAGSAATLWPAQQQQQRHWIGAQWCRSVAGCAQAEPAPETYRINVVTGNIRGAGTSLPAYVQLFGANGASEKVLVGADEGFARGSSRAAEAPSPSGALGELRRCFVERAGGGYGGTGDGWFLETIEVTGPGGDVWHFPCHAWFGHSDCGDYVGALERNLIPVKGSSARKLAPSEVAGDPVSVQAAGVAFPHPDKVSRGHVRGVNRQHFGFAGEDAYFHCTARGGKVFGMGVADGVYAWKDQGIDSGAMSRALMESAQHMVQAGCEDVLKVMQVASRYVQTEGVMGSSTAVLVTINLDAGRLQAATLGDSGAFVVGRPHDDGGGGGPMQVRFRTPQQEHEFGRPYQLGHFAHANTPEDADLATLLVRRGDIVVAGSDGLLDNLSEVEIVDEISRALRASTGAPRAAAVAQRLAKAAFEASVDRKRMTPYSRAATEAFDMVYAGGKKDDISVVVCLVT